MKYQFYPSMIALAVILLGFQNIATGESIHKDLLSEVPAAVQTTNHLSRESSCELTFGWTDWPPFMVSGADSQDIPHGPQIELVSWVMTNMGCQLKFRKLTWDESIKSIEQGTLDFIGRASQFPARERFAYFSVPYREDLLVLTVRNGESGKYHLNDIEQMFRQGFRLGVLKGGYFGEQIEAYRKNKQFRDNFIEFSLESDILRGLKDGVIDGFFEAPFTVDNAELKNPLHSDFEEYPIEILVGTLHFMFSKQSVSEQRVAQFNEALKRVKQSQQYRQHWYWSTIH